MMKKFIVSCFLMVVFFILQVNGQANTTCLAPLPDDCSTACDLGSLPAPAACFNGGPDTSYGAPVSFSMSNIGGTASGPNYSSLQGCAGPAIDVWYTFTATGTQLSLNINNSTIANPNVSLYLGNNCSGLVGQACYTGSGGTLSASFDALTPGDVYYLQISGGSTTDVGNFSLTLQNNFLCSACLLGQEVSATPTPVNGVYGPGQTVTFCYTVTNYNQNAINWLHGVVLSFGSGWKTSSFVVTSIPQSCDPTLGAYWGFYNSVTSQETGNTYGPGFFYESTMGSNCNCIDGDPGDNYGDGGVGPSCQITFCWKITTKPDCNSGSDLGVVIKTTGDYLSGAWTNPGCQNDPAANFDAALVCCIPPVVTSVTPTCNQANGKAIAKGNAVGPWTYTWKNAAGNTVQTVNNLNGPDTISNLAAGQYFVTVTDANGCSSAAIANVGLTSAAVASPSNTGPYCAGQTISLNSTAGNAQYSWSGPNGYTATIQSPTRNNATVAMGGIYTVTVTTNTGCTISASTNVIVNALPAAAASPTTVTICEGVSQKLTASGGASYLWSNQAGTDTTTVTPSSTTTYFVTVTGANNCTATASSTVNVNQTPPAAITPALANLCGGQDTTLTASGGIEYIWSTTETSTFINVSANGSAEYDVTVTDANGCSASSSAIVNAVSTPSVLTTTTDASCYNGNNGTATAHVFDGTPPYQYAWAGGGTALDSSMTNLSQGPVNVIVTDANNCIATASFVINQPPQIIITTITQLDVSCNGGNDGYITVSTTGGYPLYSFAWSNNVVGQTDSDLVAGIYVLTVTDANLCQAIQTDTINQPAAVVTNPIVSNVLCFSAADGSIDSHPSGGIPPYLYKWSNGQTDSIATALVIGNYYVTVTDYNACSASGLGTVDQPSQMQINTFVTTVKCIGQQNGTILVTDTGGVPPYNSYATKDNVSFNFADTTGLIIGLDTGVYTVGVSDNHGCTKSIKVNVPNAIPDAFVATTDSTLCYGPGYNDGGAHVITTTNGNGPYQYSIDGGPLQQNGDFFNLSAGIHLVVSLSANQCIDTIPVEVFEPLPIEANIVPDTVTLPLGGSQMVQVYYLNTTNPSYSWDPSIGLSCFDCGNPVVNSYAPGVYTVTLSEGKKVINGVPTATCYGSASLYVEVLKHQPVFIPNSFSPNGDGNNDVFTVYGAGIKYIDMKIFNRWGELVYQTNNMLAGWDGTYKGVLQLPGVFVYEATITFLNDKQVQQNGSVTLIR